MKVIYFLCLLFFSLIPLAASAQTFSSGDQQVQLIELYTSEGCSSCPPADRWLSNLKQQSGLWSEFIPVAFHVDYWDYIGWKDQFASKTFSLRQRQLAYNKHLSSVYTPAMLINGFETNTWRRSAKPKLSPALTVGKLSVELDKSITIHYQPTVTTVDNLIINIAILGMSISVDVQAGENKGRTLNHDFVVLDFKQTTLSKDENNQFHSSIATPTVVTNDRTQHAVVAWVSTKTSKPIQATGGLIN